MQAALFGDMNFRSNGMGEDCLYLNVWTPAKTGREKLPVLVYFFGGGFQAGDGSEPRYDGESMAAKGIVSLTVNYRLGVFGFFVHPDLTESLASSRFGQLGAAGSERGAAMGTGQHRGVWRRPEEGDDRGRIGGFDRGERADGIAALEGFDRGRDRRERVDPGSPVGGAAGRGRGAREQSFLPPWESRT